jgi:hypothetical protein
MQEIVSTARAKPRRQHKKAALIQWAAFFIALKISFLTLKKHQHSP